MEGRNERKHGEQKGRQAVYMLGLYSIKVGNIVLLLYNKPIIQVAHTLITYSDSKAFSILHHYYI